MSNSSTAELYFVAGMMVLILVISFAATYIFFRQWKREKANRDDPENNDKPSSKP